MAVHAVLYTSTHNKPPVVHVVLYTSTYNEPAVVHVVVKGRQLLVVEDELEGLQQTYGTEQTQVVVETEVALLAPQVVYCRWQLPQRRRLP